VAAAAAIVDAKPRSSRCSCGALGRHQNCYPPASESVKRKDPLEVEANMNRIMNNVVQELDGNTKNGRIGRFLANKFERINARECIPVHRGKARHHHHHHRRRRLLLLLLLRHLHFLQTLLGRSIPAPPQTCLHQSLLLVLAPLCSRRPLQCRRLLRCRRHRRQNLRHLQATATTTRYRW